MIYSKKFLNFAIPSFPQSLKLEFLLPRLNAGVIGARHESFLTFGGVGVELKNLV